MKQGLIITGMFIATLQHSSNVNPASVTFSMKLTTDHFLVPLQEKEALNSCPSRYHWCHRLNCVLLLGRPRLFTVDDLLCRRSQPMVTRVATPIRFQRVFDPAR